MNDSPNQPVQAQKGFFDGNPKTMFLFGLVTGVALTLIINSTGLASAKFASNTGRNNDTPTQPVVPSTGTPPTAPSGQLASATDDDHVRGGDIDKAKVVIIEYSDFQCPFCSRHHPTMQQVMTEYGDDVAWVYRHFPLTSIHPEAMPSALASECASEQGKFWEYADALFANQSSLATAYYSTLAGDLGLNQNKFDECFTSKKYQSEVDAEIASGSAAGVTGTPATFVNGQLISGAVPYATMKTVIDAELAK